ncbi:MAG: hypothetical protein Q9183_006248, partial [Haloplaca sp. 2 TL-2023]
GPVGLDLADVSKAHAPQLRDVPAAPGTVNEKNEKELAVADDSSRSPSDRRDSFDDGKEYPTAEEVETLRREAGPIPWVVNFIQNPLPEGSTTGADAAADGQAGALGMGQRASTGLTTFNSMWAYFMPLLGAFIADQYWGRFKTIQISIFVAILGHIVIIIAAIPQVIVHPQGAIACFSVGLIIFGMGTGGFKPNISPLIAEQYEQKHPKQYIRVLKSGERVIVDPTMTISRIYMYFYMMVNIGALTGQIGMVYAEKYIGFWLSFVLPTALYCVCPFVMWAMSKKYARRPPTGSVLPKAIKLWRLAAKGRFSANPVTTSVDPFLSPAKTTTDKRATGSRICVLMTFGRMSSRVVLDQPSRIG